MSLNSFDITNKINALEQANLLRHLKNISTGVTPTLIFEGKEYVNFSSNDYLGLAQESQISQTMCNFAQQHGVGSGASHLVSGHFDVHAELEEKLAHMTGYESAMLFSSGFMANLGVIPALLTKEDAVFQDKLNHASLIDGARLSKANRFIYEHLQYEQLGSQLAQANQGNSLVITDHVFSMDGTVADLKQLFNLANQHDAGLLIDDAHGFGLYYGQPKHAQYKADIYMGTLGKAVGTYGAFVAGSHDLITYLKTKARSFVFTTALPPMLAKATLKSLELIEKQPERQTQLKANIDQLRNGLIDQNWQVLSSETAIQPVIIGEETATLKMAEQLKEQGFWVIAIRPPTVPKGTCRLRITLSASHTRQQIDGLLQAMNQLKP